MDALINAGVLMGTISNPLDMTGTCYEEDWQSTPQWRGFAAVGRWAIDAGEPANYVALLRERPVLVQEVDGDETIPNVSTTTLAAILGLAAETAATFTGAGVPTPSPAIDGSAAYVQYLAVPAVDAFPGNLYGHGSILTPEDGGAPGALGTAQMQTDALSHLATALAPN